MKRQMSWSLAAIMVSAAVAGNASAQKQTAEGAQQFLASVSAQGNARAFVVGRLPVAHTWLTFDGPVPDTKPDNLYTWQVDTIAPDSSLCRTKATSTPVDVTIKSNDRNTWTAVGPPAPIQVDIDWSRATIQRGAYTAVKEYSYQTLWDSEAKGVVVKIDGKALEYVSDDADMLDRIEYAMKFLKMSCDRTADTGF